jgi:CHAT domain-containing protein
MNEERQKAYLYLINALLHSQNQEEETEILNAHSELIDPGLVQTMESWAAVQAKSGYQEASDFLINLAAKLAEALRLFGNVRETTADFSFSSLMAIREEYLNFIEELFQATLRSKGDRQTVFSLLEANLDKLDDNFAILLSDQVMVTLSTLKEVNPKQAQIIATGIFALSLRMYQFNQGSRASNLEIALAGYEAALTIFTREAFPIQWANTQRDLGNVYSYRIRGDRTQNVELAGAAYKQALLVFTRERFPQDWAKTQTNLGIYYWERIEDDREENLEKAIAAYEVALQEVLTHEEFPEEWAQAQTNLGNAYWNRIRGNKEDNLKLAIAACRSALQVFTIEDFPEKWAQTQNNLAVVYQDTRNQNDRAENLEQAIGSFQSALQVRTRETFPEKWAEIQNNLAAAYQDRIHGEPTENLQTAIATYLKALEFYTRTTFPERWAGIQNNLGNAYREQGQITEAIACYRAALTIYTPTAFPEDCFMAAGNFGNMAFAAEHQAEAIEGYSFAIEAVEKSRSLASSDSRKQKIISDAINVYEKMVQVCIQVGQPYKAIEYIERSKARNLVELLHNRDLSYRGDIPETVINELKHLRREIVAEERRLDIAQQNRPMGTISEVSEQMSSSAAWLKERTYLNELLKRQNDLITNEIEPIDPSFRATQQIKPIPFSKIQELLDDRTALIEWYITSDTFLTFIITKQPDAIILSSSTADLKLLEEWRDEYLNAYNDIGKEKDKAKRKQKEIQWLSNIAPRLEKLAQILHLKDILGNLNKIFSHNEQKCHRLILIPHRYLHLFPLHALPLPDQNDKCLLDDFPQGVSYAPSCQLLQLAQNQQRPDFDHIFAIQDPGKDLPYAKLEVETICRQYFQPHNVHIIPEEKATETALDSELLRSTHCAHFSCHGSFKSESPLESALDLADTQFTLGKIFEKLDLPQCRLVTLSACDTGLTDPKSISDEYIGLPSGFLYAGSPSVVSSLWIAEEKASAFLMIKFYEIMRQSTTLTVSKALNDAQRWLRNVSKEQLLIWISSLQLDEYWTQEIESLLKIYPKHYKPFSKPQYWAAFCAIGV